MPSKTVKGLLSVCAMLTGFLAVPGGYLDGQTVTGRNASITFGGRVHAHYFHTSVDDGPPADLFFRRVRLTADIKINDYLDGRIMPDFAGGRATLQDAYARLRLSPSFRISVGQFKRAFDLFTLESSTQLPMAERDGRIPGVGACDGVGGTCSYTRLTEKLGFAGRDTGIRIDGALGEGASYVVSVTNGEGINTSDVNQGKSLSGRVAFAAGENTEIGANVALHDHYDETDDNTGYAPAFGIDAKVGDYGGGPMFMASLVAGENWRVEDAAGNTPSFWAAQVLGSYYSETGSDIIPGIEPMLRLAFANPNGDGQDVSGILFTPGVSFYVQSRNRLGINADVFSPAAGDTEFSIKLFTHFYF